MILGMTPFTFLHVALSLVGIAAGLVVAYGLLQSYRLSALTGLFLAATALTSLTGFGFPLDPIKPSHAVAIVSLVVLAITAYALYARGALDAWRWVYVVGAVISLYLNVFVLVAQAFLKIPALKALAPTQAEPPFAIAQGAVLIVFIALGILGVNRFWPEPV
jgi:hypothetical protein